MKYYSTLDFFFFFFEQLKNGKAILSSLAVPPWAAGRIWSVGPQSADSLLEGMWADRSPGPGACKQGEQRKGERRSERWRGTIRPSAREFSLTQPVRRV